MGDPLHGDRGRTAAPVRIAEAGEVVVREARPALGDEPVDGRHGEDREDPGYQGLGDSRLPGPAHEVEIDGVVEEELRDGEVRAEVELALQETQILLRARRLGVPLRVGGDADAERGVPGPDEGDEVGRAAERAVSAGEARRAALGEVPGGGRVRGRVAAQGEHVVHARVDKGVEEPLHGRGGGADAGEMGHRFEPAVVPQARDDLHRVAARAPQRAVRDGDKERVHRAEAFHRGEERRPALPVARGEEFERDERGASREQFRDAHRGFPADARADPRGETPKMIPHRRSVGIIRRG